MRETLARYWALLAVILVMSGCSAAGPEARGGHEDSNLDVALSLVADMPDAHVMFTDWAALGHRRSEGVLAGQLLDMDEAMQRDLGIRSTEADWELDVSQPGHAPMVLLRFAADLAGVPEKLARFGYHADGAVYMGRANQANLWTVAMQTVGLDPGRGLLVAGSDASAVRSALAVPRHSLGQADPVVPLLAAAGKVRVITAALAIGPSACVVLDDVIGKGRATPAMLDAVRRQFSGTFTAPQAELVGLADPAARAAFDALTFPDERTAKSNKDSRSNAVRVVGALYGDPGAVQVTGSTVSGRVLSFDLSAPAYKVAERVKAQGLGPDICLSA
jgi:hypothetical protein